MEPFEFIKEVDWQTVFEGWKSREADDPEWQKSAIEVKGWPDWEAWRGFMASQFQATERVWQIFEIEHPNETVPQFLVGPFQGWHDRYFAHSELPLRERTFAKLVHVQQNELASHAKIMRIQQNFPLRTEMIGIRFPGGQVVCMEGSHRSVAIALAVHQGHPIDFSERQVRLALTDFKDDEWPILEEMLERGSHR